jgi:hypothetical protein
MSRSRAAVSAHLLLLSLALGCSPALTSFTPAHVPKKGHVQAEAGFDVFIPTGTLGEAIEAAEALSAVAEDRELTEEEEREVFEGAGALTLNPPSATLHIGIGYSPLENFVVEGRYTIGAWRLGARYQLLHRAEHGVDLSTGLGFGRYVFEFPVSSSIPIIELEDFTRYQLDLPIQLGVSGDWYRVWGGPRLLATFYSTRLALEYPTIPGAGGNQPENVLAALDGTGYYAGGQAGFALGYKKIFLGFELTVAQFWTSATLDAFGRHLEVDLSSLVIAPGIALMGEF